MINPLKSGRPKLVAMGGGYGSPARAALAIAIEERRTAEAAVASLRAAEERLREGRTAAWVRMESAKDVVRGAKEAASRFLLASAIGTAGEPPITMEAARAALQAAEDNYAIAQDALSGFGARMAEAERAEADAAKRVLAAAKAVVAESPAARSLLEKTLAAQRELLRHGRAFAWMVDHRILPGANGPERAPRPGEEHHAAHRTKLFIDGLPVHLLVEAVPNAVIGENERIFSTVPEWQAAMLALSQDANAPLPGGDR